MDEDGEYAEHRARVLLVHNICVMKFLPCSRIHGRQDRILLPRG